MNYESSSENIDSVTTVFTVSIPSIEIEEKLKSELNALAQKVSIKGFRPGKAPKDMVEKLHGKEVRVEVMNKLISSSLGEIIKEKNLNYVGQPTLDIETTGEEQGQALKFKANFSLYPVPELKKYDSFEITLPKVDVADKDVDQVIDRIRSSSADYKKITDRTKVESNDTVQCNIAAIIDGEPNKDPSPMKIEVNGVDTPEEIKEALLGTTVGETKSVTVKSISEDEKNQGKDIQYQVTAVEIFEKVLPEMTDDYAKSVDKEIGTVLELRLKINDLLKKEREQQSRTQAEGLILKELAGNHDFKVPQVMVDMEIYNMLSRANMFDPSKTPFEQFNAQPFRERMGNAAEERVKASVLVDKIAQVDKLLPSEDETKQWFEEQKERLGEEVFKKFLADQGYVQSAWVDYTRRKVLDFLIGKTKIEYVTAEEFEKIEKKANKAEKAEKAEKTAKAEKQETKQLKTANK